MSKILLPYVFHSTIDNKYYIHTTPKLGKDGKKTFDSLVFNTGIRQLYEEEYNKAYLFLLDMLLLYDVCYIPADDLVYLFSVIGKDNSEKIINSGAIETYDSFSSKIAVYSFQGKYTTFIESIKDKEKIKDRIERLAKNLPKNSNYKEWYTKSITRYYEKSFYLNNFNDLIYSASMKSLADIEKPNVIKIIENSRSEETDKVDYNQIKLNRLLHFHYYVNLTKHIGCDYLFVPKELNELFDYYNVEEIFKDDLNHVFDNIRFLEDIPDIPKLIEEGTISIDDVLEIRKSKESHQFRKWINKVYKDKPDISDDEIKKVYFQACMNVSSFRKAYESKKGITLRTIGAISASAISPAIGLAWTISDASISSLINGFNPSKYSRDVLLKTIEERMKSREIKSNNE
jgi:hypothetical protein